MTTVPDRHDGGARYRLVRPALRPLLRLRSGGGARVVRGGELLRALLRGGGVHLRLAAAHTTRYLADQAGGVPER